MYRLIRWMLLVCILGMASCHSDDAEMDKGSIRVVFRIYLPSSASSSANQATASRSEEDARNQEGWESAVNPSRLHVILYTSEGKNVGALENVVLLGTSAPNVYDVTGSILMSKLLLEEGVFHGQLMVYANMDGVDDHADFSEALTNKLTFGRDISASAQHFIPMWGIKQLGVSLQAGKQTNIGTVNLLRAEAKIHVSLREDMLSHYELSQVVLTRANQHGYCLPSYLPLRDLQDVQLLDDAHVAHILSDRAQLNDVDMSQGYIYVPEYSNLDKQQATSIRLTLRDIRDGKEQQYVLPFVKYDDNGAPTDKPVDILRNHDYRFTVYKGTDDMLGIHLTVRSWYAVRHDDILM